MTGKPVACVLIFGSIEDMRDIISNYSLEFNPAPGGILVVHAGEMSTQLPVAIMTEEHTQVLLDELGPTFRGMTIAEVSTPRETVEILKDMGVTARETKIVAANVLPFLTLVKCPICDTLGACECADNCPTCGEVFEDCECEAEVCDTCHLCRAECECES